MEIYGHLKVGELKKVPRERVVGLKGKRGIGWKGTTVVLIF